MKVELRNLNGRSLTLFRPFSYTTITGDYSLARVCTDLQSFELKYFFHPRCMDVILDLLNGFNYFLSITSNLHFVKICEKYPARRSIWF